MYPEDTLYPDYKLDEENWVNIPYSWMRWVCSLSKIYMTGLTGIYPLQPQTEDLQELCCVSCFYCLFKFSFHFLAIVRNILNSSELTHRLPSNQRTDKYICQASLAKTVTEECLFSLPLYPTIPHAADDQQLLPLNEPESSALPSQTRLVLQHLCKL